MRIFPFIFFLMIAISSCSSDTKSRNTTEKKTEKMTLAPSTSVAQSEMKMGVKGNMTDSRDGEIYATITIGKQTWMAENLRYNSKGSMVNPDNPSKLYGRLYEVIAAQTACPNGWHLPSDAEWDQLEMAHGMPPTFIGQEGWRGKHAANMKSLTGWDEDDNGMGNGTNLLGFNVLPAGYYFSEKINADIAGLEGLHYSAAYWSSMVDNKAYARFMFNVREFVNKWADENNETGSALSCRCIKD